MKSALLGLVQSIGFALYFVTDRLQLFRIKKVEKIFIRLYFFYKSNLENLKLSTISDLLSKDSTVVDVGANIGWFTINVSKYLGNAGLVIAIEPGKVNSRRFKVALQMYPIQPSIRFEPCALSDTHDVGYLMLDPKNPANHQINISSQSGEKVELKTLDSLVENEKHITLVKIDVQGHELEVLVGGTETLKKHSPILLVEIDNRVESSSAEKIWKYLDSVGYDCVDPISRSVLSLKQLTCLSGYFDILFFPKGKLS